MSIVKLSGKTLRCHYMAELLIRIDPIHRDIGIQADLKIDNVKLLSAGQNDQDGYYYYVKTFEI